MPCPVCQDPAGIACCEFGRDRAPGPDTGRVSPREDPRVRNHRCDECGAQNVPLLAQGQRLVCLPCKRGLPGPEAQL